MDMAERNHFWNTLTTLDGTDEQRDIDQLRNVITYPQFLYRFRTVSVNSLDALRTNKMLFSRADYFDDPFDSFLHIDTERVITELEGVNKDKAPFAVALSEFSKITGIPIVQLQSQLTLENIQRAKTDAIHYLQDVRKAIQREIQAICFTEECLNEVLWLKYAGNHSGYTLEYNLYNNQAYLCGKSEKCSACPAKEFNLSIYPVVYTNEKYDATTFARAVAIQRLISNMLPSIQLQVEKILGIQTWEREKISLIKKECHKYDKEWRAVFSCPPTDRPFICWRPESVTLGLRCSGPDRNCIIEMAKVAGITKIYECYIDSSDNLARHQIMLDH